MDTWPGVVVDGRRAVKNGSAVRLGLVRRPRAEGLAAELLGCDVCDSLGELPAVTGEVDQGAVPLPVLSVDRRLNDTGAVVSSAGERSSTWATRTRTRCVEVSPP